MKDVTAPSPAVTKNVTAVVTVSGAYYDVGSSGFMLGAGSGTLTLTGTKHTTPGSSLHGTAFVLFKIKYPFLITVITPMAPVVVVFTTYGFGDVATDHMTEKNIALTATIATTVKA